jgi:Skp family chaperone for outer membrane proteins
MSDNEYSKFNSQISDIHKELENLINQLNTDNIPSRDDLIKIDYTKRLEEFDIIKDRPRKRANQNNAIDEKSHINKSLQEVVQSLLSELSTNKKKNLTIIRDVFTHIEGIEEDDKEVLINSLSDANVDMIKKSISDIISAFNKKK